MPNQRPKQRTNINRTVLLAVIAVAALLLEVFPEHASAVKISLLVLGVLYGLVQVLRIYPSRFQAKRRHAALVAADAAEYAQYSAQLVAMRTALDPHDEFAGKTDVPQAYRDALETLHAKYQVMLTRKFGSH